MKACVGKQLDPGRKSPESLGSEGGLRLLFLGPTGAGKTRVVEATAEVLFGDLRAVIKVFEDWSRSDLKKHETDEAQTSHGTFLQAD